jgi:hypothetical protein
MGTQSVTEPSKRALFLAEKLAQATERLTSILVATEAEASPATLRECIEKLAFVEKWAHVSRLQMLSDISGGEAPEIDGFEE